MRLLRHLMRWLRGRWPQPAAGAGGQGGSVGRTRAGTRPGSRPRTQTSTKTSTKTPGHARRQTQAQPRPRARVEELERRILYSAELNPLLAAGLMPPPTEAAGPDTSALVQLLHDTSASATAATRSNSADPSSAPTALDAAVQASPRRHEILFVDAGVADAQTLIDSLLASRPAGTQVEVVQIQANRDGLRQITEVLAGESGLDAVHIVSHGAAGQMQLGQGLVTWQTLAEQSAQLQRWSLALGEEADLLLWGCDVGQGELGENFVQRMATLTGADVAASTDLTGSSQAGGNWTLERQAGHIDTVASIDAQAMTSWQHVLLLTVDATTSGTTLTPNLSLSHTTSGTDRLMLVGVSSHFDNGSVTALTYNGVSLTFVGAQTDALSKARVEIWAMVAPPTGTYSVNVTFASGRAGVVGVMTFTGVNQATPYGAFSSAEGNSATASLTGVLSAANELVFGVLDHHLGSALTPTGTGQNEYWDRVAENANGGGTLQAGSASVALSWSLSGSEKWAVGALAIKPANTAPVLDASLSPALAAVAEDAAAPVGAVGTLVSSLVDFATPSGQVDNVTDPDTGALLGIAVTAADTASGSWYYSVNGGSNWSPLGVVTNTNARLLAADASTRLYFQPNANTNGTLASAVTLRAWDQFSGSNGGLADTSSNGGSTAFSSTTDTASLVVTAVNDAPTLGNGTLAAVNEDTASPAGAPVSTVFSGQFADIDTGASFGGIAIVGNTANPGTQGVWQYSSNGGSNWFAVGTVADGAAALAVSSASLIRFVPVADYNGSPPALNMRGLDDTYVAGYSTTAGSETRVSVNTTTSGGSTAIAAATATLSTSITAVNDAPTLTNGATVTLTATNEDTASSGTTVNSLLTSAGWADVDSGALKGIAVTAVTGNATWQYSTDGVTWAGFGAVAASNALLLSSATQLRYLPDSANGETASFAFKAWDQTTGSASTNGAPAYANPGAGGGTAAYSSGTASSSITVTSVNDAPVLSGANNLASVNRNPVSNPGTALADLVAGQLNDVDVSAVTGVAVTAVDNTNGVWQYSTNGGGSWSAFGTPTVANARLLLADASTLVRFVPNANWSGTVSNGLSLRGWDQTSGVVGNTADTSTNGGSTAFSTALASASITVTASNTAPVLSGANNLDVINEDPAANPGTLVSALIAGQVTDVDPSPISGIAVTAVDNTNGTWQYTLNGGGLWNDFGAPSTAAARLLAADANTYVRFVPGANWNGTVAGGISFQAWDQASGVAGGTASVMTASTFFDHFSTAAYSNNAGSANWSSNWVEADTGGGGATAGNILVTGGALRVGPDATGDNIYRQANLTGLASAVLSFDFNNTVVSGKPTIQARISADGGTTYSTLATFTEKRNTGGGSMSFDISAYASSNTRVQFLVSGNAGGPFFLALDNVQISAGASGGATAFSTATASASITVNAVNDMPVRTAGTVNNLTVLEDAAATPLGLGALAYGPGGGDDESAQTLTYTVTAVPLAALGNITLTDGVTVVAASTNYSLVQLQGMRFLPTANANGGPATFSWQVVDSGGTANGGVDTLAESLTISVTAVNDAPTLGNGTLAAVNEDTASPAGALVSTLFSGHFADIDAGASFGGVAIVGNTANAGTQGVWQYSSNGGSNWFAVGTAADGATALAVSSASLIRFVPVADYNGTPSALTVRGLDDTYMAGYSTTAGSEARVNVNTSTNGGTTAITAVTATLSTSITPVNDAPILSNGARVALPGTHEDTTSSITTVDSLLTAAGWADIDASSLKGMAVTSVASNGAWQYSTDGFTWRSFGTVTSTSALLLGSSTQLRYLPDSLNGEVASFGFKAWDQSTGTASTSATPGLANPGAGGGTTAFSSPSASAQLVVTPTNDAPTATDRALVFDGSDLVVVPDAPSLVMGATTTIEAMVMRTGAPSSTQIIVNKEGEYELGISATGKLQWAFASASPGLVWVETAFTVPADTWVHLAITYNAGTVGAYVNGQLVDSYSGGGNIGDVYPATNDLTIGGRQNTITQRFVGLIDEVRVWNVARSAAQIQADSNTVLSGAEAGLVGYWRFNETAGTSAVDGSTQGNHGVLGNGVAADVPARTTNVDYTLAEDSTLTANAAGVLAYASDPDGSVPSAVLLSGPANASVFTLDADGSFSYTPTANFTGADSFVFAASDGSLSSRAITVRLNVTAVNDAPTLGDGTLAPAAEDTASPSGQTVAAIFAAQFADQDAGSSFGGIAVVGNIADAGTQGTWQYSTDSGNHWFAIGSVADDASALALDTATLIRFVPVVNYNGTPTALTVRGLDNSHAAGWSTTAGVESRVDVDTSVNGGSTAIAAASATLSTAITAVNDAPTLGNGTLAPVAEDTANPAGQSVASVFAGQFNDIDAGASFAGIAVVGNTANAVTQGAWQYTRNGGTNWFDIGAVTDNATALALDTATLLRFVPVAHYNGTPAALIVRGLDNTYAGGFSTTAGVESRATVDSSASGSGTAIAAATATLSTTISAVNDAPTLGNGTLASVAEDTAGPGGQSVASLLAGQFNDIDAGASFAGVAVVGNTANAVTEGAWQYSRNGGAHWFDIGAVADGATALALDTAALVRFVPVADYNGTPAALMLRGLDNTYGGGFSTTAGVESRATVDTSTNGGTTAIAATVSALSTAITAVNDAPTLGNGTLAAVAEDTASPAGQSVASVFAGRFSDIDAGASFAGIAVVGNTANAVTEGAWQYSSNSGAHWFDIGTVADDTSALALDSAALLRFVPVANYNGTPPALTVRGLDNSHAGGFSTTAGVAARTTVDARTNGGTTAIAAGTATFATAVLAVNDAPIASGSATLAAVDEDATQPAAATVAALFGPAFSDTVDEAVGGSSANSLAGIAIATHTVDAGRGAWQYASDGGAGWTALGNTTRSSALTLAATDLLRFVPAANYNGDATALVAHLIESGPAIASGAVVDLSGATGGSTALSAGTVALGHSVQAVNDAPTLVNGAVATLPGTSEDAASAGTTVGNLLAAVGAADVDTAAASGIAITARTGQGEWQYSTDGLLWTSFGPVSAANALLLDANSLLRYLPDTHNGETAGLRFQAWDQTLANASTKGAPAFGQPGAGGGGSAYSVGVASATLAVADVNDAPRLNPGAALALPGTHEDAPSSATQVSDLLSAAGWADVDHAALSGIAVLVSTGNGDWQYSTDGLVWTAFAAVGPGQALLLDAASQVRYAPDGLNAETAGLNFQAWDRRADLASTALAPALGSPGAGGGSSAYSVGVASASLAVAAVNDAPTLSASTPVTLAGTDENTASPATAVSTLLDQAGWADADTGALRGIAITGTSGTTGLGQWQYSADGLQWTDLGSVDASRALLLDANSQLRYLPDAMNGDTAGFSFVAWDQTSGSASTDGAPALANTSARGGSTAFAAQVGQASLVVSPLNDAPTLGHRPTVVLSGTDEDTASAGTSVAAVLGAAGWADVDMGAQQGIAVTATSGRGQWQYATDGLNWTHFGPTSAGSALLLSGSSQLRYLPDAANGETVGFSFAAWDQTSASASVAGLPAKADPGPGGGASAFSAQAGTATLVVTALNDAPSLADNARIELVGTDENTLSAATLVSALLAEARWADVDTGSPSGIVVTAASANGSWQYSRDGSQWVDFGQVSAGNPLRLLATDQVRYAPDLRNGETASFAFQGWDQSQGVVAGAGTTPLGGARPQAAGSDRSAQTATVWLTVSAVNDAPELAVGPSLDLAKLADSGAAIDVGRLLAGAMASDSDAGALRGLAITGSSGSGSWQYSTDGQRWAAFGSVSAAHALLLAPGTAVRYVSASAVAETASFDFKAWDQSSGQATQADRPAYGDTGNAGDEATFSRALRVVTVRTSPVGNGSSAPAAGAPAPAPEREAPAADTATEVPADSGRGTPLATDPAAAPAAAEAAQDAARLVNLGRPPPAWQPKTRGDASDRGGDGQPAASAWMAAPIDFSLDASALLVSGDAGHGYNEGWLKRLLASGARQVADSLVQLEIPGAAETRDEPASAVKLGVVGAAGITMSVGMLWWLTRGGGMLFSVLMGAPAWRHIDLLPIVAQGSGQPQASEDDLTDDDAADEADGSQRLRAASGGDTLAPDDADAPKPGAVPARAAARGGARLFSLPTA